MGTSWETRFNRLMEKAIALQAPDNTFEDLDTLIRILQEDGDIENHETALLWALERDFEEGR